MPSYSRALVTGGAGFVGSHIVDALIEQGFDVTVLDDFSSGKMSNLEKSKDSNKLSIVRGDICDLDVVKKALRDVEIVFHEAALVSVQRSVEEPQLTHRINIEGTETLLRASQAAVVKRVIAASSAAVYGDSPSLPRTEDGKLSPMSPYASSKVELENLCGDVNRSSGMTAIALRYFNIYGERSSSKAYSGVINAFAEKIVKREPITIYGDGTQSRDFVNVRDIVEANLLAASKNSPEYVFNVGTGKEVTVNELATLEARILKSDNPEIEHELARKGDVRKSYADTSRIRKELGFEPRINLSEGLAEYLHAQYPVLP